jgi:hypothetical protein
MRSEGNVMCALNDDNYEGINIFRRWQWHILVLRLSLT